MRRLRVAANTLLASIPPPPHPNHAEIAKFVRNLDAIRGQLAAVAQLCRDRPSRAAELRALLEQANAALHSATREGPLIEFAPPAPSSQLLAALSLKRPHEAALVGWLPSSSKPATWVLKFQATKDGWSHSAFHSKCDGVQNLLVVVKCTGGHVFGGYTSVGVSYSNDHHHKVSWTIDAAAFLFTLTNPHSKPPTKFAIMSGQEAHAVRSHHYFGPTFGAGHDFSIGQNTSPLNTGLCNLGNTYQNGFGLGAATFTGANTWTCAEMLCFAV